VLNERQAGVAIEGGIRQERLETSQLAVDTHGYTDFAMALARLLGFDLCPRLKELKQRHLFVPRGTQVPDEIKAVCEANVDVALIEKHWDSLVHLAASVMSGHASAVAALARFGSAAQGDPIYDAGVPLGRLLRTAFLADYFVKDAFRNELRRVLNRGEAVNALKRAIYTGRISPAQAKRGDEIQAVADARRAVHQRTGTVATTPKETKVPSGCLNGCPHGEWISTIVLRAIADGVDFALHLWRPPLTQPYLLPS